MLAQEYETTPNGHPMQRRHMHDDGPSMDELATLSTHELIDRLADAYDRLAERDNDLLLAARYGSSLLEANASLQLQLADLAASDNTRHSLSSSAAASAIHLNKPPNSTHADDAKLIAHLEKSSLELHNKVDRLSYDLDEAVKRADREARKALDATLSAKRDVDAATKRVAELEDERKEWIKEKSALVRARRESMAPIKDFDVERRELLSRIDQLEEDLYHLRIDKDTADASLALVHSESQVLQAKCNQVESLLHDYQNYKEEATRATEQVDVLSQQLEQAHDIIEELKALKADMLSGSITTTGLAETEGSKTLFGEVDSKRLELEEKHLMLARRHQGLMKAHEGVISQQERMRHHLARLAQIASVGGDASLNKEDKYSALSRALAQSEAECRDLRDRVAALERAKDALMISNNQDGTTTAQDEVIQVLRLNVNQLTLECRQARKAAQTSDLLRASEIERGRLLESKLLAKEDDLKRFTAASVKLGYDLDAAKAKIKQLSAIREEVVHVLVVGGKDRWHRATQYEEQQGAPSATSLDIADKGDGNSVNGSSPSSTRNEVLDHGEGDGSLEDARVHLPSRPQTPLVSDDNIDRLANPSPVQTPTRQQRENAIKSEDGQSILPSRPDTPTTPKSSLQTPQKVVKLPLPKHIQVHVESGKTQAGDCEHQ
ncbi:hypothetical protein SeMB42_g06320 [Synchytrium endobioticum]|uniref:Uncharacterized protein n=1 Tax=Synchytrium endobioticum TaxID=286115 RepID=A0A507D6Q5_9FUNG|nr:hypothetical protein SeMB42_g06320 [Synchytrium endobioticum]TPX47071.1 hypothetical protein SeLEV6574_g02866 [Synchytrium endobioticum]